MPVSDFLPFATGGGANVESQAAYAADARRTSGFQTGVAPSAPFNKVWRQAAFMAAVVANVMLTSLGVDILDDGDLAGKSTLLVNTVKAIVAGVGYALLASPAFTGTPTAPTVAGTSDSSTKLSTTAFVQAVAALLAPLLSPAFTGTPTGTTPASALDNTLKIPTTAWIFNWAAGAAGYTRKAWATYTIAGGALTLVSSNGMTLAYVSAGVYTLTVGALASFGTGALKINVSNGSNATPLVGFGPRVTGAGALTIKTFTLATTATDGDFIDVSLF